MARATVVEAVKLKNGSTPGSQSDLAMPAADAEPGMSGGGTAAVAAPALPSQPPGERALSVLWSFAKCLGALLPVYLAGYFGFSISVVLFALMIYMGWKHSRLEKVARLKFAMFLLENEKAIAAEKAPRSRRDLPPWVSPGSPPAMLLLCCLCHLPHLSDISATASLYALTCLLPYALAVYSEAPDLFTYCLLRQLTRFPPGPKFRHSYVQ